MFLVKNAIKNIYRYRKKYILFGALYFIIILAASVCVNIFIQMEKVTDNIIKEYASVVRFNPFAQIRLTKDEFLAFGDLEHIDSIKFFKYSFSTTYINGLVWDENQEHFSGFPNVEIDIGGSAKTLDFLFYMPVFVLGYDVSLLHLVADGFNLEKGRMFENGDEAVIAKNSKAVRSDSGTWTDLDLGDKVAIKNEEGFYKEFTVVGILEENPDDDMNTNRRIIYTTFEGAEYFDSIADKLPMHYVIAQTDDTNSARNHVEGRDFIIMGYDVLGYLDSPDNYYDLKNELLKMDKGALIESFHPNFASLVNLTQNMKAWSVVFMVLIGLVIVFVTIISTAILLNSRKYEIAVLRSIGMKKSRLIASYLVENLAFVWGVAIVPLISAQFISNIFTRDVFAGIKNLMSPEMFGQLTSGQNFDVLLRNAGIVFAGATAVVGLSLALACIDIVRFQPLKIFNKQY